MANTKQQWQDIKNQYDNQTAEQLNAIKSFFRNEEPPKDVQQIDQLVHADQQFSQCVSNLYQLLPQSAQTATPQRSGSTQSKREMQA